MTTGLRVSEDELRRFLVNRLEIMDAADFDKACRMAARLRIPLERAVVERGRIPLGFLLAQLAETWGIDYIDLKVNDVKPEALGVLTEEYARTRVVVPFALEDRVLRVAMWNPRDHHVRDDIERMTGRKVRPYLAPEPAIRRAHLLYKGDLRAMLERAGVDAAAQTVRRGPGSDDGSAVELVDRILEYAAVAGASDIHIEPYELETLVRYRVDGVLQEVLSLSPTTLTSLVARIKVRASMRIDERRAPQDGRFEADLGGVKIDLRVSAVPTHWGEKVVMRVLSKEAVLLDLEDLGLAPASYQIMLRNILRPHGMILITGPTGSGKTSTLYAMLVRTGAERGNVVNISTIEDPVEYTIPRIVQIPVNPTAGVEFAAGLRALLRQDPDVIMVGEIRDRETADIAMRAALVGRLLISTLHTNDSTGAVPRLLDMGVEPFLLASTLTLVVAQRLVRRICLSCRESMAPDEAVLRALRARPDFEQTVTVLRAEGVLGGADDPLAGARFFRGKGCVQCGGTGFRGRLGIFELFEIDERVRAMIMDQRDASALRREAIAAGMKTMVQDGLAKVFLGETTVEEVLRVAL
jgi:type IV pilus assembly protein PilB